MSIIDSISEYQEIIPKDINSIKLDQEKLNISLEAINYFSQGYFRDINEKALIMIKDSYTSLGIILRKSVTIFNCLNFELINEIRNIPDNFPLDNPEKIVIFQHNKINYIIIYTEKIFAIFNLSLKDNNNYVIFQISDLEENETIINIKPLNNDLRLPYFILVTSNLNVHILSIINLNTQANFLSDTYFETTRLNENEGIFKKLTSYLLPAKLNLETDNIFILNPSHQGLLYKNNSKFENSIFLFNQNCLKMIEFSFINNRLRAEIIKLHNARLAKENKFDLSIEDADVLFDKNKNSYLIYTLVNINEYFYIMKIGIDSNYRVTVDVLKDMNNLRKEDTIILMFTKIKKAKIFLNKDLNEFYTILSYVSKESTNEGYEKEVEKSFIYFYSSKSFTEKDIFYKKVSATIDGVVPNFVGNKTYLNILFNKSFIIELLFDVKGKEIIYQDISSSFYRGVMMKNTFIKPTQNKLIDLSMADNKSEIMDNYNRPSFFGEMNRVSRRGLNGDDYNNQMINEQNFKGNSGDRENRVLYFLTNKLRKYYDYKIGIKEADLNAIYDINIDIEELTNFLASIVNHNNINNPNNAINISSIRSVIDKIISNIIDNESLNINNINMDSKKSEYIIIDYLKERAEKYEIFLSFLKDYKIFENFDSNRELYSKCLLNYEKLKSAIKLREQENFLLKNHTSERNLNFINNSEQTLVNISHNFYNECFKSLKQYKEKEESTNINKYSVYLKISKFDYYLKHILTKFNDEVENIQKKKEENLYLAFNLVNLWNSIFFEIKKISYVNELANNELEISRMVIDNENNLNNSELNTDYNYTINAKYYEDYNNFSSSIWLVQNKEEFLEKLEKIFIFLVKDDKKEIVSIRNNLSNFSKTIIDFVDNLLFFYRLHYNFKFSAEHKKIEFEKKKRELINKIINFDYEKSLKLAIKYQSLLSISYICNLFKCPEKLKEYFNTIHKTVDGGKQIEYMLKVYLVLEMEKKVHFNKNKENENNNFIDINKNKNNNQNEIILYFDFFNVFGEYHAQMLNIVRNYPKINFYYEIFIKSREGVFDRHMNIEKTAWEDFLNVENLINAINNRNNLENIFKMTKYVLNLNLIAYEENKDFINYSEENLEQNNSRLINVSEQENQKTRTYKLNSVIQKINFYYMLYYFNISIGMFNNGYKKFLAGPQEAYNNLNDICNLIEREFSTRIRNKDYDYLKLLDNFSKEIKKLLNLIKLFRNIYEIEDNNRDLLILTNILVHILIQIDFTNFIKNDIELENMPDENISKLLKDSIYTKLKDKEAFEPNFLNYDTAIEDIKTMLSQYFPEYNHKIHSFTLFILNRKDVDLEMN